VAAASGDVRPEAAAPAPWSSFRGPNGSGIADGQRIPLEWDSAFKKNVRFATPIEGFSVSSPIVWGNRIFVLSAVSGASDRTFRTGLYGDVTPIDDLSEHRWLLYALDTRDGRIVWERELERRTPGTKRHSKSSQANATPVTDGKRIVSLLGSTGFLYCHDFEGNLLWKKEIGVLNSGWFYDPDYQWGHSSSPILYDGRVMVQADVHGSPFIAAYGLENGNELWRTAREGEIPTFGTPTVYHGPTGDELVTNGTRIRGYDPATGVLLWHLGPNSEITVGSPVVTSDLIYVTAGYPPVKPIYAIRPGSRGDLGLPEGVDKSEALAWSKTRGGTYIPSPLVYRGYLYTNDNNGLLVCYDAATGELVYRARIGGTGGAYSASPIAADGRLYFTTEEGETFVVEAGREYRLLAKNRVEGVVLSTPAASDGLVVIRTLERVYGIASP
jgi:outer membrane protein assembly factor BamB